VRLGRRFAGQAPPEPDLVPWHALQSWLELTGCREVRIPFGRQLALGANPHAVRLRRDFRAVLDLVRAHAMLHQAGRERDEAGNLLATIDDYRAVYRLVIDYVSEGMGIAVSPNIRQTVESVAILARNTGLPVTLGQLAHHLGVLEARRRPAGASRWSWGWITWSTMRRSPANLSDWRWESPCLRKGRPCRIPIAW
jgi:hypothetical protein